MLFEVLFTLALAALLFALMGQAVVSLSNAEQTMTRENETAAMWQNASRAIREDVHAAKRLQSEPDGFLATLYDSRMYRYDVNSQGQLVRTQTGGGTAVLAVGVTTMTAVVAQAGVEVTVTFSDGTVDSLYVADYAAMTTVP